MGPSTIISDMDSIYISQVWNHLMDRFRIKLSVTTPYHQQADQAERSIQTIETILREYNAGDDWTQEAPFVERCLNNATNASTGYAPNELLFITPPNIASVFDGDHGAGGEERAGGVPAMVAQHTDLLDKARRRLEAAKDNIDRAQKAQKKYYDKAHRRPDDIEEGDSLFLLLDLHPVRSVEDIGGSRLSARHPQDRVRNASRETSERQVRQTGGQQTGETKTGTKVGNRCNHRGAEIRE
jgi:hypothetical protein